MIEATRARPQHGHSSRSALQQNTTDVLLEVSIYKFDLLHDTNNNIEQSCKNFNKIEIVWLRAKTSVSIQPRYLEPNT